MALPMSKIVICLSIVFSLYFSHSSCDDEFESLSTLVVEHSLDQGSDAMFSRRGVITIRSLKSGIADYTEEEGFSPDERDALKQLAEQRGLYRLRIRNKASNEDPSLFVSTFVQACSLYESGLSDILTLNVDQSGNLLAVSMATSSPYCHGISVRESAITEFNTSVEVVQTVHGPIPETQSYIQKMEQEEAEKQKGQQADNRSFFAKYWMYIVPVFIFLMFASGGDPSQGGGGGGGGR